MSQENEKIVLARYRMKRAWEALDDARFNASNGRFDTAATRIYYAIYRACLALLFSEPKLPKKHSTVIGIVNQKYVRTGRIPRVFARIVSDARELRENADYRLQSVTGEDVEPLIGEVEELLKIVEGVLEDLIQSVSAKS